MNRIFTLFNLNTIFLGLGLVLLPSLAIGQTTVFSDDFSTNTSSTYSTTGAIGASDISLTRAGADWGGRRNTSPAQLELTNDVSATTNAAGWVFASTPLSNFSSPYNTTLGSTQGSITWTFNMRTNRGSALGGFSSTTVYGMAVVLVSTSTSINTSGNGYAVVMGGGTSNNIALVSFTTGLQGTRTTLIGYGNTPTNTTDYISVKVTYDPSTNGWELLSRDDGTTTFADPASGSFTSIGTVTNSTYTGTAMSCFGAYWQGSTAAAQTSFFDNFKVTVTPCSTPSVVSNFTGSTGNTQTSLSWTNGSCYDEMVVVARSGSAVSFTPSGDGTAYTANTVLGSGTDVGSSQYVVYKGTGATTTVTSLTNNTTYHFAIYTRKGTTWSSAAMTSVIPTLPSNTTDYFRSATSGDWATTSTWESSTNNSTWQAATLTPSSAATAIYIKNTHTVTITSSVTIDDVTIEDGGIVSLNSTSGTLNLNNGTAANDIDIQSGGILTISGTATYSATIILSASSNINIATGGKITFTGSGGGYAALGTSSSYTWNTGAILEWNSTSTPALNGVTIFPNASTSTYPILRISSAWGTPGGGNATIINGKIEVNASFSWNGGGTKTFRNGIIGTATMSQSTFGQWIISGTSADLGSSSTLTLSLGANGMLINSGVSLTSSGTVALTGSGTMTVSESAIFNNLTLNGSGLTISGSKILTVNGALALTNGTLTTGANTLTIAGNSITRTSGNINASSGTIAFTNTSALALPASTFTGNIGNMTINGAGGVSLGSDLTVTGTLNLTSGKITLGANTLTLGASATITPTAPGVSTSYVVTDGAGVLKRSSVGGSAVYFPIGTSSEYLPINSFTNAGTVDDFGAKVSAVAPACVAASSALTATWDISETLAGGSNAAMTLQYNGTTARGAGFTNATAKLFHCTGATPDMPSAAGAGGGDPFTISGTGFTSFSPFGISNDAVLSIELSSFKAKANGTSNQLTWSTLTEKDNAQFHIERSANAHDFSTIGMVKGSGTTNTLHNYSFNDLSPFATSYYRLRAVDFAGKTTYSDIVSVIQSSGKAAKIYPSVVSDILTVETNQNTTSTLTIMDKTGRIVLSQKVEATYSTTAVQVNVSTLANGLYILMLEGNGQRWIEKFLKN